MVAHDIPYDISRMVAAIDSELIVRGKHSGWVDTCCSATGTGGFSLWNFASPVLPLGPELITYGAATPTSTTPQLQIANHKTCVCHNGNLLPAILVQFLSAMLIDFSAATASSEFRAAFCTIACFIVEKDSY